MLDFGDGAFNGNTRYLEINVRKVGTGTYTPLTPRQKVTSSPSAISFTGTLAGDVTGAQAGTVVVTVGGLTAAQVASGATAANNATSAATPGRIVARDGNGNFQSAAPQAGSDVATKQYIDNAAAAQNAALANEVNRAQGAEAALGTNLTNETARAQNAEAAVAGNLTAEIARALAAESALADDLAAELARAQAAEAELAADLAAEVARAEAAEGALDAELIAEIARAMAAEASLSAALAAELARAQAAEAALTAALNAEIAARQAGDAATLATANAHTSTQVAAETAARQAADSNLPVSLTGEIARALAAEGALAGEVARATNAENAITASLNAEVEARQGAVAALQNSLNAKADKVSGAMNGNFAGLNASGNLTDSGKSAADFLGANATAADSTKLGGILAEDFARRSVTNAFAAPQLFLSNGTGAVLSGTPVNAPDSALLQLGTQIAGGNTAAGGGTYIGLNSPATGSGSAADFIQIQKNGAPKFAVTASGAVGIGTNTPSGVLQVAGGTGEAITAESNPSFTFIMSAPQFNQSFTASIGGMLSRIEIQLERIGGTPNPTLEIRSGGLSGLAIHNQMVTVVSPMQWQSFEISPPVPLIAGSMYAVSLSGASLQIRGETTNPYPGGSFVNEFSNTDANFRAYVQASGGFVVHADGSSTSTGNFSVTAGVISGNGSGITNVDAASLGGLPGSVFLDIIQNEITRATNAEAEIFNAINNETSRALTAEGSKVSKSGDTMTGFLTLNANPTANLHAATKQYVDSADAGKISRTGDAMAGPLVLAGDPLSPDHATRKSYVDNLAGGKISKFGDTMFGSLTLAGDPASPLQAATKQYADTKVSKSGDAMTGPLTLSGSPAIPLHAATKAYVDAETARAGSRKLD